MQIIRNLHTAYLCLLRLLILDNCPTPFKIVLTCTSKSRVNAFRRLLVLESLQFANFNDNDVLSCEQAVRPVLFPGLRSGRFARWFIFALFPHYEACSQAISMVFVPRKYFFWLRRTGFSKSWTCTQTSPICFRVEHRRRLRAGWRPSWSIFNTTKIEKVKANIQNAFY